MTVRRASPVPDVFREVRGGLRQGWLCRRNCVQAGRLRGGRDLDSTRSQADGDAIVASLSESIPSEKQADTFSVLEQMDAAHPQEPHWYLPWLGVDPMMQGTVGGARGSTGWAPHAGHGWAGSGLRDVGDDEPVALVERHGSRRRSPV